MHVLVASEMLYNICNFFHEVLIIDCFSFCLNGVRLMQSITSCDIIMTYQTNLCSNSVCCTEVLQQVAIYVVTTECTFRM